MKQRMFILSLSLLLSGCQRSYDDPNITTHQMPAASEPVVNVTTQQPESGLENEMVALDQTIIENVEGIEDTLTITFIDNHDGYDWFNFKGIDFDFDVTIGFRSPHPGLEYHSSFYRDGDKFSLGYDVAKNLTYGEGDQSYTQDTLIYTMMITNQFDLINPSTIAYQDDVIAININKQLNNDQYNPQVAEMAQYVTLNPVFVLAE